MCLKRKDTRMHSDVLGRTRTQSDALRCNQTQSRRNQTQSRRNQTQSDAIRRTQTHSDVLGRTRTQSRRTQTQSRRNQEAIKRTEQHELDHTARWMERHSIVLEHH
jgi:hypothetical protein